MYMTNSIRIARTESISRDRAYRAVQARGRVSATCVHGVALLWMEFHLPYRSFRTGWIRHCK